MSKDEMRKPPLCIKSPNMFDSVVMTDDIPPIRSVNTAQSAPQPIKRFNQ